MSTDTIALFGVADAIRGVEAIRECATTMMPDALLRVSERYFGRWTPKEWKYDDQGNLLGPGGFSIRTKGRIVEVYHLLSYSAFTQQDENARLVLNAFYFMCRLVGSQELLLLHELLPWEGTDLDTISEGLLEKIGPPARDWAELSKAELFEPGCWLRVRDIPGGIPGTQNQFQA